MVGNLWERDDLTSDDIDGHQLTPIEIEEIEAASSAFLSHSQQRDNIGASSLPRLKGAFLEHCPSLAKTLAAAKRRLLVGRGFVVLRGLPVWRL